MEERPGQGGQVPEAGTVGTGGTLGTSPDLALTTAEAAQIAGVSARTIRRWIAKGMLPAVAGAGGVLYVFRRDIEAARIASGSRPSPVSASVRDCPGQAGERDIRDRAGPTALSSDPTSEAAAAVLIAWRDTVLAPVVAELSATRKELGDARQAIGRLEVERDALWSRLEQLEAEQSAAVVQNDDPGAMAPTRPGSNAVAAWWDRLMRLLAGG